ncbi:hypothetical protein D3C86_1480940 [compost metagenome]
MVDAAWPKPSLRDLEAPPLAGDQVFDRHADVLQHHLGVTDRRFVIAEDRQHPLDAEAGRVGRHNDLTLLLVRGRLGVGLAHDDGHGDVGVGHVGRPPLATVDHIVVAVADDAGLDIGRIGRSHLRLGHQEGRADLSRHQRLQPAFLLHGVAVHVQDFHIAGVGRVAVEHLGRPKSPPHQFGQGRVFKIGQPGAVFARQEHVP